MTALADALLATGLVNDPWIDGYPRFEAAPLFLEPARLDALHAAAAAVLEVHEEAVQIFAARPELLGFLGLTPVQELLWRAGGPRWHGYARADVFECEDGSIQVCELNCDTPTGQPEALALSSVLHGDHPGTVDPNARLGERMVALLADAVRHLAPEHPRVAALVYPTEMAEDLGAVLLFQRWAGELGYRVVLGSPYNLDVDATGQPTLCGEPFALLLRHYKTDWWCERLPAWQDEPPFEETAPFARELHLLLKAEHDGRIRTVNPWGAVVAQNKRVLAFLWERMDLLSPASREKVRRYIPHTVRMEALHREQLVAERELWVLKSDYGCEGDEVVIGSLCTPEEWRLSVELAVPGRWVAQRRFAPRIERDGRDVNFGVFGIAGVPVGCYARLQQGQTDYSATSVPVFVRVG